MADDPKKNPNWRRPSDWPYEEDWGSEVWKTRMARHDAALGATVREHGFLICPKCGIEHTAPTLTCRICGRHARDRDPV